MRVIPAKTYQLPAVERDDPTYEVIKVQIFWAMVILSGVVGIAVWVVYGGEVGLSYGVGACSGMVYLRMLARSVDRIGGESGGGGSLRLAVFIAVMVVALRWEKLAVLPVFLGFVTYKGAILLYAIQDLIRSSRSR